jgi:hypothetical protein
MPTSQEQADVCLKLLNEAKQWYVRMALLQLTAERSTETQSAGKQCSELADRTSDFYAKSVLRELAQEIKSATPSHVVGEIAG